MRPRPALVAEVVLWALLFAASSASRAEDGLLVTKIRTEKVWLYECADLTKKAQHPSTDFGDLPRKASVWNSEFLQVTIKNGESKCVRAYVVETNLRIPIKGECGPKDPSPKAAAGRNVGEGCKP